jgi:hypothetical protein
MDNTNHEKVNELIELTTQLEYIWPFHPDNPEQINVTEEFKLLMGKIKTLQSELDNNQ